MASSYLTRVIRNAEVLSASEQRQLIREAQGGNLESKHRLIVSNLRLVLSIARKFEPPDFFDIDDLVAEGTQGLDKAIDRYDLRNVDQKPSTFFYNAIKWKILNFLKQSKDAIDSLNEIVGEDNPVELIDLIVDPSQQRNLRRLEAILDLKFFFSFINEKRQTVLILSYGLLGFEVYSYNEIGKLLNRSGEWVRQFRDTAIEKLAKIQKINRITPGPYSLVSKKKIQALLNKCELRAKSLRSRKPQPVKRPRKKGHDPEFDLTPVDHNFKFSHSRKGNAFVDAYGEAIRADRKLNASVQTLAEKYRCPTSQIRKAIAEEKE